MANFELNNDAVYTVTIHATNAGGQLEPLPSGVTFTATSSNPASLGASIGADASGNPALVLTPLVQASPNLSVTVADAAGLTSVVQVFDIIQDATPANLVLDLTDATHVAQAAPTAAGP